MNILQQMNQPRKLACVSPDGAGLNHIGKNALPIVSFYEKVFCALLEIQHGESGNLIHPKNYPSKTDILAWHNQEQTFVFLLS